MSTDNIQPMEQIVQYNRECLANLYKLRYRLVQQATKQPSNLLEQCEVFQAEESIPQLDEGIELIHKVLEFLGGLHDRTSPVNL